MATILVMLLNTCCKLQYRINGLKQQIYNIGGSFFHPLSFYFYITFIYLCSNLSDVHLNRLISFAEKGSLVFIDVQHNNNLRPALVVKLQETLTKNAAENSRFQFHSIETRPRSILKQRPASAGSKPTIPPKKVDTKGVNRLERTVVKPPLNHPPPNLETKRC